MSDRLDGKQELWLTTGDRMTVVIDKVMRTSDGVPGSLIVRLIDDRLDRLTPMANASERNKGFLAGLEMARQTLRAYGY